MRFFDFTRRRSVRNGETKKASNLYAIYIAFTVFVHTEGLRGNLTPRSTRIGKFNLRVFSKSFKCINRYRSESVTPRTRIETQGDGCYDDKRTNAVFIDFRSDEQNVCQRVRVGFSGSFRGPFDHRA